MSEQRVHQLPLNVGLRDDATFGNFLIDGNTQAHAAVKALCQPLEAGTSTSTAMLTPRLSDFVYLWGAPGSGRSHLLQAACHQMTEKGGQGFYLPLAEVINYGPDLLDGLEHQDLVCLDQVELLAGRADWEEALFHCFNRLRDAGRALLVAADQAPAHLPITLPDLASRLTSALTFHLQPMDDEAKLKALQLRSQGRGLVLSDEVAQYILNRSPRDLTALFEALETLDKESLRAQRKLTIPFVKDVLNW